VRFDHGPEFVAYALADRCRSNGTGTIFIDPGSPRQNGFVESFNGRMCDEHLNGQLFAAKHGLLTTSGEVGGGPSGQGKDSLGVGGRARV
jgi:transposase InsO family protein